MHNIELRPGLDYEVQISPGIEGVKQTLALMAHVVGKYKSDPFIITTARMEVATLPARDWPAEAHALCRFVQRQVRYTLDTVDVEVLIDPVRLLTETHAGDCDDLSMAVAALCMSVGLVCRFIACGFKPDELTHVFVQAQMPDTGEWISLDASEPHAPGWQPPDMQTCYAQAIE